jgi:threonine dehydrogenase-like Zn-dependent dehydrogenase
MGHEYVGVVQEVGSEVRSVKVGDFVVGSFWASDNTCDICQAGYQAYCVHRVHSTRPGGHVGFVGVSHDVAVPGDELFMSGVHLHGGPAPVRRFLPELIRLIWDRAIDPGKVFDLTLPLDRAAEGYEAMDQRTATKVLLTL